MPKEYIHKVAFKNQEKAKQTEFEIKEEEKTIQFYDKEPDDEDSPKKQKVILKCEDILIEYCERLVKILKKTN